jgi:lipopolysaccharide transport system permease protein
MTKIIITPHHSSVNYALEIWQQRGLLWAFFQRDLRLRYKQTILGLAWVIVQPLLSTLIFTLVFGRAFSLSITSSTPEPPYALFVFSGLVWWQFFADSVSFGANSLLSLGEVIKKIYFPRLISPLSSILVASVNFSLNFFLFIIICLFFSPVSFNWPLLPLLLICLLVLIISAAGLAFGLAALNLRYRDVKHALPFALQLLLFLSPVIYPPTTIPQALIRWTYLNPLTAVINTVRTVFFRTPLPSLSDWLLSALVTVLVFVLGLSYFHYQEKSFADYA